MDIMQVDQQKQKQQMNMQEQQQQMREHLTKLQSWDLEEGQSVEERRRLQSELLIGKELQRNKELRKTWINKKHSFVARAVAEGSPVQIQKPAKKTYKQRREDARLDELAKEKSAVADHVSIHMAESLRERQQLRDHSFELITDEQKRVAETEHVDLRLIHSFLTGYQKNAQGEPADDIEQQKKIGDQRFIDDYLTREPGRRNMHLNRMVVQVLSTNISEDMMTEEYLEHHAGEMQEKINRMVAFQNVMNDPINQSFFDNLSSSTKMLLRHRVLDRYALYGAVMARICSIKAVNPELGKIMPEISKPHEVATLKKALQTEMDFMRESLRASRVNEQNGIAEEYERLAAAERTALIENSNAMKTQVDATHTMTEKGADMAGLGLTAYAAGYTMKDLADYRKLIEDHPKEYAANAPLVDKLYQELYRAVDSYGDLAREASVAQGVIDRLDRKFLYQTEEKNVYIRRASIKRDEYQNSMDIIGLQMNAMTDALKAILEGAKLSKPAKAMISRLGY